MKGVARRDFLQLAGVTAGALALSPLAALFPRDPWPDPLFIAYSQAADALAITTRNGIRLGELQLPASPASGAEPDVCCPATGIEASAEYAQFAVPAALLPIYQFPISLENIHYLDYVVELVEQSRLQLPKPGALPGIEPLGGLDARVGRYYIRFSVERHRLGSCIDRTVTHAGALVRDATIPGKYAGVIVNVHVAAWIENGHPCLGVYGIGPGGRRSWCRRYCNRLDMDAIYALVLSAIAVYLTLSVAQKIAVLIAAGTFGTLVAIPGVPPPP